VLEVERHDAPISRSLGLGRSGPTGPRPFVIQSDANTTLLPSTKRTMVLSGA
jgi:hypothetical protein